MSMFEKSLNRFAWKVAAKPGRPANFRVFAASVLTPLVLATRAYAARALTALALAARVFAARALAALVLARRVFLAFVLAARVCATRVFVSGVLAVIVLAPLMVGCSHRKASPPVGDPALRALGQASIKVQAERMESPLGEGERAGGQGGPLSRLYFLNGRFEGRVSEALLAISASLGYGLSMTGPAAGDLIVAIEPAPQGAAIFSLIKGLNRQLSSHGAVIGVDIVNRRLTLSSGGAR